LEFCRTKLRQCRCYKVNPAFKNTQRTSPKSKRNHVICHSDEGGIFNKQQFKILHYISLVQNDTFRTVFYANEFIIVPDFNSVSFHSFCGTLSEVIPPPT